MMGNDSSVRPEALDYLAGYLLDPTQLPPSWEAVPVSARRMEDISGIGFNDSAHEKDQARIFATEALLAGLAGATIPCAFQVQGSPEGVRFSIGTWSKDGDGELHQQHQVLTSLLDGIYPSVTRASNPEATHSLGRFPLGGIAHGIPNGLIRDGDAPWDRLLRGLQGANFAVIILAEPIDPGSLTQLRDVALEDLRAALSTNDARGAPPLTLAYERHIEALVESLNRGLTSGAWRTGVYLLGDVASYWRLAAAWQGLFSNTEQVITSLRVLPLDEAAALAAGWSLPYQPAPSGPRLWQHPFLNQSLLDTRQLASVIHFPRRETPGFTVRPAPLFAVSRPVPAAGVKTLDMGDIYAQQRSTGTSYAIDLDQLTRHVFVAGLTGAGKTNTVMHLLMQASASEVPFLVIEPAKTEYRALLSQLGMADKLRVFTLGREQVAPLRLNPFEVPDGIDVATHIDLLKAVFMGSFALWIPLPQILEQCLVDLYTERGWDFAEGQHRAGKPASALSVPTLGELVTAVERTVPTLGFKGESTQEITASLTTRLNGLRRGARGLMLDVERSIPMSELLRGPTVIELEGIGDDGDKAFIMGLLLVRLYEHRRAENTASLTAAAAAGRPAAPGNPLLHLVVVEEAHRLLAGAKKQTDSWNADPKGAFSEAFSQMLSEVRAYGQGIVISDQVPVRLSPDVIKNTNLKIAHRLVAGDDREAMAAAMSMNPEQSMVLATLPRGRAAVFSEGDHTPVIVAIPKTKDLGVGVAVDDNRVALAMQQWRASPRIASYFQGSQFCAGVCPSPAECRAARVMAGFPESRVLATRLFNTMIDEAAGLDVVWPDLIAFVAARTPFEADLSARAHGFAVHALHGVVSRRAIQANWPAGAMDELVSALRDAVAERARSGTAWLGSTAPRRAVSRSAYALMQRSHNPYPLCALICPGQLCRYRDSLLDTLAEPKHAVFSAAADAQPEPNKYVMQVASFAAADIIALSDSVPAGGAELGAARWRAIGCAAQIKFCAGSRPEKGATLVRAALIGAGWSAPFQTVSDV